MTFQVQTLLHRHLSFQWASGYRVFQQPAENEIRFFLFKVIQCFFDYLNKLNQKTFENKILDQIQPC